MRAPLPTLYAVIGRSENMPTLYHMNQTKEAAERLRTRREHATGQSAYVVPMAAWLANPLTAVQNAEQQTKQK
ncbi:MAG: hypothetical protein LC769_04530 [Chloroflexi bacterium]|nr:hypothetical protein [Chloroflexota bacterium]